MRSCKQEKLRLDGNITCNMTARLLAQSKGSSVCWSNIWEKIYIMIAFLDTSYVKTNNNIRGFFTNWIGFLRGMKILNIFCWQFEWIDCCYRETSSWRVSWGREATKPVSGDTNSKTDHGKEGDHIYYYYLFPPPLSLALSQLCHLTYIFPIIILLAIWCLPVKY